MRTRPPNQRLRLTGRRHHRPQLSRNTLEMHPMTTVKSMKALGLALVATAALAAVADQPRVVEDPENVVASRLAGEWVADNTLDKRLGGEGKADGVIAFVSDPSIARRVPELYHEFLEGRQIYMAGIMTLNGAECPFLLTENSGNPHVLFFLERDGDPMGNGESFNLMLARGVTPADDALFIGGDFNNQAFSGYRRKVAKEGE